MFIMNKDLGFLYVCKKCNEEIWIPNACNEFNPFIKEKKPYPKAYYEKCNDWERGKIIF